MGVIVFAVITMMGSVILSSIPPVPATVACEEQADEPMEDTKEPQAPEITVGSFQAIINFVHIDLHFSSYLIDELVQVSEVVFARETSPPLQTTAYFKTLFRRIICPNAP